MSTELLKKCYKKETEIMKPEMETKKSGSTLFIAGPLVEGSIEYCYFGENKRRWGFCSN